MKGKKMGWQKDDERNEPCSDISANECFCLKMVPALPGWVLGLQSFSARENERDVHSTF